MASFGKAGNSCGNRNPIFLNSLQQLQQSGKGISSSRGKCGVVTTVKGTFGHAKSRDRDGKLFSLDRTLSNSSSDIRFQGPFASDSGDGDGEMEVFEPNSNVSMNISENAGNTNRLMTSITTKSESSRLLTTESQSQPHSPCKEKIGSCTNENCNEHHFEYLDEDDEFSTGLPSDLPSGMVDIEGNLIDSGNVHFGQDEENDLNEDDDELSSLPDDLFNYRSSHSHSHSNSHGREKQNHYHVPFDECVSHSHSSNSQNRKMGKRGGSLSVSSKKLPDFRNPHQFNDFIQLRSHRGRPTKSNSNKNNNNSIGNNKRKNSGTVSSSCNSSTITQHYYPEGGWGYVVLVMAFLIHALLCGIHLSSGIVIWGIVKSFNASSGLVTVQDAAWLAALSVGVSLFLSPIWVSICKRKSTRLAAVFGGLVASLGCLFTSFASQFHQLFLSYAAFMGIGVGLTRDASSLMVGQYFKRKRDLVEVIVVSASGLGILLMSASIHTAISSMGWRLGLQAITGVLILTFFLGTCYRSASLYHPQRRAILHLKNQKRKIKEKEKLDDQPPFLDFSCLRSKTVQILLLSSAFTAFGINTPLFFLAIERDNKVTLERTSASASVAVAIAAEDSDFLPIEFSLVILQVGIGISWIIGCFLFGLIVIQKNQECRVSKQYLCQIAGVMSGISILALATTEGFNGLVIFSCVYGFSLGGYNYALKVYTYERVRARHFPRAWSFIQSSQAIPLVVGVPLAGYVNANVGWRSGYYMSAISVIIGAAFLFLTDVRKRRLSRKKLKSGSIKTVETSDSTQTPKPGRLSFSFPVDQLSPQLLRQHETDHDGQEEDLNPGVMAQELTCISGEGIPGIDLQGICYDEWAEYLGGDITSCNKVENCLASEFDADPIILDRRTRRWSAAKSNLILQAGGIGAASAAVAGGIIGIGTIGQKITSGPGPYRDTPETFSGADAIAETYRPQLQNQRINMSAPREIPGFRNQASDRSIGAPGRTIITVIDEDSV